MVNAYSFSYKQLSQKPIYTGALNFLLFYGFTRKTRGRRVGITVLNSSLKLTTKEHYISFRTLFQETDFSWTASPTGWAVLPINSFFSAWSVGSGVLAHYKNVTTREALDILQNYPITHGQFSPLFYMEALNEENVKSFSFPKLQLCFVGGEPANEHVIRRWKEETGVELWNLYGQTEMVRKYR